MINFGKLYIVLKLFLIEMCFKVYRIWDKANRIASTIIHYLICPDLQFSGPG